MAKGFLKIKDLVLGTFVIDEPLILELINSPVLQRLKGVDQGGYTRPFFKHKNHNRFDHSIGVYLLLRRFKAGLAEQAAGLIHDVSHTAFSHSIDYVLESGSQKNHSHQDDIFADYVREGPIPGILERFGLDPEYVLNEKNFPLLETELPDLCADRIDYSLRGMLVFKMISQDRAREFLGDLAIEDNKWVFNTERTACDFARKFSDLNRGFFCGLRNAVMFRASGDYFKYALDRGYVSKQDFFTTDDFVLEKINQHLSDPELQRLWNRMNRKDGFENDPKDCQAVVYCKSRVVDPLFRSEKGIKRISDAHPDWKKTLDLEIRPKKYCIKFTL